MNPKGIAKERPILFSAAMVKAILADQKTQTRRIFKGTTEHKGPYNPAYMEAHKNSDGWASICPYGRVGDLLWVKESYQVLARWDDTALCDVPECCRIPMAYVADGHVVGDMRDDFAFGRTRPSIYMPRWASRITLEVTGVKVERVRSITEADAISEGIQNSAATGYSAVFKFQELWDSINGKRPGCSWEDNPWVWCIEFRRVPQPMRDEAGGLLEGTL